MNFRKWVEKFASREAEASRADARALHRKGLELLRAGQAGTALDELRHAARLDPQNAEFLKSLGNAQRSAGDLEGAADTFRKSLEIAPDYAPSIYNLGLVLRELGRLEEAERCFRRSTDIDPRDSDALTHLGSLLHGSGRLEAAVDTYRAAIKLEPGNPILWMSLGKACSQLGQVEESLRCLRESVRLKPDLAEAHYLLGVEHRNLGEIEQAVRCYREALEFEPGMAEAHDSIGNVLLDLGRLEEAREHYREAIRLSPDLATAHNNLGCVLVHLRRLDEAEECFRKAIDLRPDYANAHFNLGNACGLQGANDQALRCAQRALELDPEEPSFAAKVLLEVQQTCEWSRLDELCAQLRRNMERAQRRPVNPFCLLSIPSTPEEQLRCAARFSAMQARAVRQDRERLAFRFDSIPKKRLTIGYLSADFHEHATAYLTAELYELHDRGRFEVIGYSYGPDDGSAMRARLRRAFDRFVDVTPLSLADAAAAIHADGVDILVDLKGHTMHARTEIMALRPAPIQVNYLGYPGTMGAEFIDYLVGDRFVTPRAQAEAYSEKLVLMAGSYQVNDRKRALGDPLSRQELGLPEKGFVLCCFNQAYKIMPNVFSVWMRTLQAVPGSVLWLLDWSPSFSRNLRHEAGARGVDPDRLIFAPALPLAEHLRRLSAADLFLDTMPYNAHTTASDALWAGLPVLTCAGDTFASRVAGSLLHAIGLPELVTETLDQYERLALHLARDPAYLHSLRHRLKQNRSTALLFDTERFVRDLETAYQRMHSTLVAGAEPSPIEL